VTKIKICGITEVEHAVAATVSGADFLGLVFALSKRRIETEKALQITAVIRSIAKRPLIAGIFVNMPVSEVNEIARYCNLDYVQLSGSENWDYCKDIEFPIIKVIHIYDGCNFEQVIGAIEAGYKTSLKYRPVFLLDTQKGDYFGGTGQTFDWTLAKEVASAYPVIVAGGLTPDNVNALIKTVRPWGVDVSSGVETSGGKDINKIKSFIDAARKTESKS
jgi:phosphoribosylanthranilate isomerase